MEPHFWQERWQKSEIGFHKHTPHPLLSQHWQQLGQPHASIFVPLCGKSLDLLFLQAQGYSVIGCELSAIAIADFFTEHNLLPHIEDKGRYRLWHAGDIRIIEGDFFALAQNDLPPLQGIYDRAALVALPAPMRERYARQLLELAVPMLLITFEHEGPPDFGPPFAVFEKDIQMLFGHARQVTALEEREAIDEMPHLPAKGIHSIREKIHVLHP
jgi:thiopurine S-methyltransferase